MRLLWWLTVIGALAVIGAGMVVIGLQATP